VIERKAGAEAYSPVNTLDGSQTSYTDFVSAETVYQYRIRAVNIAGEALSNERTVAVMNAPTGLAAISPAANRI